MYDINRLCSEFYYQVKKKYIILQEILYLLTKSFQQ